jgi:hypothetical protein
MGATIGAIFGLVYVLVNAGELPSTASLAIRALGVVALAGLLALLLVRRNDVVEPMVRPERPVFGRAYWLVVLAEVIALFGGLRIINGPLDAPEASVGWVSIVVGLHFVALAVVWNNPFVRWLGGAIALCGATGLVLAMTGASQASIAVTAGVLPGFLLLGTGWWYALMPDSTRPAGDVRPERQVDRPVGN